MFSSVRRYLKKLHHFQQWQLHTSANKLSHTYFYLFNLTTKRRNIWSFQQCNIYINLVNAISIHRSSKNLVQTVIQCSIVTVLQKNKTRCKIWICFVQYRNLRNSSFNLRYHTGIFRVSEMSQGKPKIIDYRDVNSRKNECLNTKKGTCFPNDLNIHLRNWNCIYIKIVCGNHTPWMLYVSSRNIIFVLTRRRNTYIRLFNWVACIICPFLSFYRIYKELWWWLLLSCLFYKLYSLRCPKNWLEMHWGDKNSQKPNPKQIDTEHYSDAVTRSAIYFRCWI